MNLVHLKKDNCSVCGAVTTEESQTGRHTNGQWFERKRYKCGHVIEWSPNFSKQMTIQECPKHEDEMEKQELRRNAKERLQRYIDRLDVDEDYKNQLLSRIEYA